MRAVAKGKLKTLFMDVPAGEPLTARRLAALGISADLAVAYVRSGWLVRLARGVYHRVGDTPELGLSLLVLRDALPGLHIGGRTALQWHALMPPPAEPTPLTLYGWDNGALPSWFTERFPASYQRKRLIREEPGWPFEVTALPPRITVPAVSSPERALLEFLSEVGVGTRFDEARHAVALAGHLRGEVLQGLLERCTSVKTVRLCVTAGQEFGHPWYAAIVRASLPGGSARPWVAKSAEGLLVLPPL